MWSNDFFVEEYYYKRLWRGQLHVGEKQDNTSRENGTMSLKRINQPATLQWRQGFSGFTEPQWACMHLYWEWGLECSAPHTAWMGFPLVWLDSRSTSWACMYSLPLQRKAIHAGPWSTFIIFNHHGHWFPTKASRLAIPNPWACMYILPFFPSSFSSFLFPGCNELPLSLLGVWGYLPKHMCHFFHS